MRVTVLSKLICGLAGGSAFLVTVADSKGYLDRLWSGDTKGTLFPSVLKAARPPQTAALDHAVPPPSTGTAWDNNWDKRDPLTVLNGKKKISHESTGEELENCKAKASRHILLIRHSQYNLSGTVDKERILTPLGREQGELTGQRLAALGLKYNIIVHSTMTRATETASIISKYLPDVESVSCDLLREGAPIEPVPPISRKPDCVYHEDGARIEAAFRRYIHRADVKQAEDSYEIIVCHANVIRYFVCRALQFPPEGWLRLCLNNGSITWLTIRPSGRVGLRMMGDSGFMPPDKLTRT